MVVQLRTLYPGRSIYNGGVGGQNSTQIAARQGGVIPLLTLLGNTIPASGPVTVTAQSVAMQNDQGPGNITGTLAGVHGTLHFDNVATFTFTRDAAGPAVAVGASEPFVVDRFGRDALTTIFWYGRNNVLQPAQTMADLAASVAALAAGNTRFVILSVINGGGGTGRGTPPYNAIMQVNADLAAAYPSNFIDVRTMLVSHFDPALPQDVIDHANDTVPTSLRTDAVHLTSVSELLVAQQVKAFLDARGW